jgi:ribonuclease P protein subunit RPR2
VQNKAQYSRISFLQQAAAYFATLQSAPDGTHDYSRPAELAGISRRLVTDMRSVTLKTRIRLAPAVKRTICKFCDSVLVEGESCTARIENKSKGGKKPWADVLVLECKACGGLKRCPINAKRPPRKTSRGGEENKGGQDMQQQTQDG